MINKKFYTLFLLIFLISFVSATTLQTYKPQQVNIEFNFTQTCQDATFVTLSTIITPNSTETININMVSTGGGSYEYNYTPNQIGRYDFTGISDGCLKTFAVYIDVTPNGKTYDTGDSLIRIFVAIFFILMMVGLHRISKGINYDQWYENIKERYITRNFVKWSLAAMSFNIMKNLFIIYFMLGLPIMLILVDLVFIYNITSIATYMKVLLYIYIALVSVLGVVFLSYVQEWFMDFIKMIEDIDWGIEK